jgi:signal transduction histidine kinase/CheY-like chemotaxis protein/HPt (histidine-containing phosphotransfer) domain-containing protein
VLHADSSISVGGFKITAPPLGLAIALPLVFFVTASLSLTTFGAITPIWISNAFTVVALLRNKRSTWPVLLLLGEAADYASNVVTGTPIIGFGYVACNTVEILLIVSLLRATGGGAPVDGVWPLARLALVCLVVPGLSSAGGAGLTALVYGGAFLPAWKTWYLSAASGQLTITPLLLSWTEPSLQKHRFSHQAQTLLLAGLVAVVGYVAFNSAVLGLYLIFPFLLLAAFSGRLLGATTATAALTAVAVWSTLAGHGPIAARAGMDAVLKVQLLQLFIASILFSALPVAAFLEQRERLMAQLRETTQTAQAAALAKAEFMAVMSHEIRTPMTAVLGMAELLLNAHLHVKEREYVMGIQRSGRHLLALINDILDFSRAEAKKLNLETIDFDLRDVLEQVRSLLAPQAAERGLELRFEAQAPLVLRGDPTRLKQVLVNLVGNAIKFTPRGSVTVATHHRVAEDGRNRCRFEVRDTGIGISAGKQGDLFSAFSQMDASTTREYGGSGLGLAISKKLVEAMGGEIGVASRPGEGSLFWFEVALERGNITLTPAAERGVLVASPPRLVLLVEDVELNRVLIADMLRSYGHEVTTAENGQEAVTAAAREIFDLVLMDVQMPVMDGVEATRQIRRLPPPARNVPILALSANVMPEDRAHYLAAGMNGALTKPIDWPQLFEALAKYGPPAPKGDGMAPLPSAGEPPPLPSGEPPLLPPGEPPLDEAVFERLRHVRGSGNLSARLAEIFMHDTARRLEELREAERRADAPAVARIAHAIKGSAATLGAPTMVKICAILEADDAAADLGAGAAHIDTLHREFTRVREALAAKLTTA